MAASDTKPYEQGFRLYDPISQEMLSVAYGVTTELETRGTRHVYGCVNDAGDERVVFHEEIDTSVSPPVLRPKHALGRTLNADNTFMLRQLFAGADETPTGEE